MIGDLQYLGLYLAVALVIFGFLAALYATTLPRYKGGLDVGSAETDVIWGPVGFGKSYDREHAKWFGASDAMKITEWSYPSAYVKGHTVYFDDPADAYEYVVAAVKEKNRLIDRVESSRYHRYRVDVCVDEWRLIDTHMDREYWLDMLNEFKEDV